MKRERRAAPPPPLPIPREAIELAMERVAEEYLDFLAAGGDNAPDPKAFTARYAAARAALAHLVDLAALAAGEATPEAIEATTDAVLEDCRARMAAGEGK